ncbi:tyrosine-protein phosphatase [Microbacterium sediminicola]|uniref:Tyrosine-protein phosphatase n=1 Tax=Microbacterium sediminicola TaxID=415210 RepID=A0ABN2IJ48_9MICO
MSRLDVPGTFNFREVAPGRVQAGSLFRSDALDRLGEPGRRAVVQLDLRVIIDLRSDLDLQLGGRDDLDGIDAEYVRHPILSAGMNLDPESLDLRRIYRGILTDHGDELALAMHAVAQATGPALVHCTAGKDRTGLVVALTLDAVGVDRETILEDYALTTANLAGAWSDGIFAKLRGYGVEVTDPLTEVMAKAPPAVLRDTFAWLESAHGDVRSYLASIGVDDVAIEALRRKLLVS